MAVDANRAPFESHGAWAELVMKRDLSTALQAFAAEPPLAEGLFRVHLEMAAAYRQAAHLAAQATLQVYREDPRDDDPKEVPCLLGLSENLLAQYEQGDAHLAACVTSSKPVDRSVQGWRAWRKAPRLELAGPLGTVVDAPAAFAPGTIPTGDSTTLSFADQEEGRAVRVMDPSTLFALAIRHEQAALASAPGQGDLIRTFLDPWRLPIEAAFRAAPDLDAPPSSLNVPDSLLFGSTLLAPADLPFLSEISNPKVTDLEKTMLRHAETSPLAATLKPCFRAEPSGTGSTLSVECLLNQSKNLQDALREAMVKASGGEQGYHRPFSLLARVALLRAAERLAERIGDEKLQGLLIINTLDLGGEIAAEPHFLLSVAAWDAGNRNTLRAQDLLHALENRLPGVANARFPLDALHVRISRASAPEIPMH
jgi:hypothetical protein